MYIITATVTLSRSWLSYNTATGSGGGVYVQNSDSAFIGNTFNDNMAGEDGGGIYLDNSPVTLVNNEIHDNTATNSGGGLHLSFSPAMLTGNTIQANQAGFGGGGLLIVASEAHLENSWVAANTADVGGGLYMFSSDPILTNTMIVDNQAGIAGSGLYLEGASPYLLHTTIARNSGGDGTGVFVNSSGTISHTGSSPVLTNTILVSQSVGLWVSEENTATLAATLWGSDAWANEIDWTGSGLILTGTINLWDQPGFVDPDNNDYHLSLTSAAIDQGLASGVGTDIDGEPRPFGSAYDLGADEVQAAAAVLTISKTGPAIVDTPDDPISYTLTVTNSGNAPATSLVLTDVIPLGANYVSSDHGGAPVGNEVRWNLASLDSGASLQVGFVVTAEATIVNTDYGVVTGEGVGAMGDAEVVTKVRRNWRLVPTITSVPVQGEQAMAYDSARSRIVLYGGNATGWAYTYTTWEFDGDWHAMATPGHPPARYGTALVYDPGRGSLLLFGGSDETDTAFNQTWEYTNTTWSPVSISGTIPLSRTQHSLVAAPDGTIYLFGGNDGQTYYNDLWQYQAESWVKIEPNSAALPISRTLAAMAYDSQRDRLLLFGGRDEQGHLLADLWLFEPGPGTWSKVPDDPAGPPGRRAHSLTYDPDMDSLILIGGIGSNGHVTLGDTWQLSLASAELLWSQAEPATPLPPRAYHQAVYVGDAIVLFSRGEVWSYE
jgi:uncharacterized repeat protein (TIGR01451 family)